MHLGVCFRLADDRKRKSRRNTGLTTRLFRWQRLFQEGYVADISRGWRLLLIRSSFEGSLQHTTAISLFGGSCTPNVAAVGISLESLANLALMSTSVSEASTKSSNEEFCIKMLQNFANYASSFSITNPANPAEAYVPLKTVNAWFDNFKRRLEMDPNFWKWGWFTAEVWFADRIVFGRKKRSSTNVAVEYNFTFQILIFLMKPKMTV